MMLLKLKEMGLKKYKFEEYFFIGPNVLIKYT